MQANIFSTNIDLFVESAAETTGVEFNDGFIGSTNPVFSEANFQKSVFSESSDLASIKSHSHLQSQNVKRFQLISSANGWNI